MKSYEVTLLDVLKTSKTNDFSGDSRTALMDVDGLVFVYFSMNRRNR